MADYRHSEYELTIKAWEELIHITESPEQTDSRQILSQFNFAMEKTCNFFHIYRYYLIPEITDLVGDDYELKHSVEILSRIYRYSELKYNGSQVYVKASQFAAGMFYRRILCCEDLHFSDRDLLPLYPRDALELVDVVCSERGEIPVEYNLESASLVSIAEALAAG